MKHVCMDHGPTGPIQCLQMFGFNLFMSVVAMLGIDCMYSKLVVTRGVKANLQYFPLTKTRREK